MFIPDRGLFLGLGRNSAFLKEAAFILKKNHAYCFTWAIIYTFHCHPMYNTLAHTTGFLYTAMLLTHGALMKSSYHTNKYIIFLIESFVLLHGTATSVITNEMWPMFFGGFFSKC